MSYQDRAITCQDCGESFTFSAEDQSYHALKGYTNEPKRCPSCRLVRRQERTGSGYGESQRELYSAVCANCGKEAQVPFRPSGDRPVYCSDCYSRQGARPQRY